MCVTLGAKAFETIHSKFLFVQVSSVFNKGFHTLISLEWVAIDVGSSWYKDTFHDVWYSDSNVVVLRQDFLANPLISYLAILVCILIAKLFKIAMYHSLLFSVVWTFQNLSVTQILREIKVGEIRVWNMPFEHFERIWSLTFMNFRTFCRLKFTKSINFRTHKAAKRRFWNFSILQNWFHVKSMWQENPEISTLCSWG